jgi:hypothetical protein
MAPASNRRKKSGFPAEKAFEDPLFLHSFAKICCSLRDKDDLPTEAKGSLSERALAKVSYQLQLFMESAFGRGASQPSRSVTKLPSSIFRDFSAEGALFNVLHTSLCYQYAHNWKLFDLTVPERLQDGVILTKLIESRLKEV